MSSRVGETLHPIFDSFLPYENKCETILNIAEGPGGFIEALVNYRKKYHEACDKINAITLKSTNKEIPGWDKSYQFLVENKNVKIPEFGQAPLECIPFYEPRNVIKFL